MHIGNRESRRLLIVALGLVSLSSLAKLPLLRLRRKAITCEPPPSKVETPVLKLLGQDGRLVEVDASRITVIKKKISEEELKDWVKHSV